jgi:hypothetical protein
MDCYFLSTPDLTSTTFADSMRSYYDESISVGLNKSTAYADESAESKIYQLNQELLKDLQKKWYQLSPSDLSSLKSEQYKDQASEVINMYGKKSIIFQDALGTFFMPVWRDVIKDSKLVFQYSTPSDCATMLRDKWRLPLPYGLAIWESHVIAAAKNMVDYAPVLISSSRLAKSPARQIKKISRKLAISGFADPNIFKDLSTNRDRVDVDRTYKLIFDLLEKGKLDKIASLSLSDQSSDMIEYYGQMRSGFEQLRQENEQLQARVFAFEQLQTSVGNPESTADSFPTNEEEKLIPEETSSMASEGSNSKGDSRSDLDLSIYGSLVSVKVYIDGMDDLEFYSEPDSAVIDMLQTHIANSAINRETNDEMIYLNYGEGEDDALYFMTSTLKGMEIQPIVET